jgi:hypothetical protein
MSNNIHAQAVSNVEDALRLAGISVVGFSGVIAHVVDLETQVGGVVVAPGKYVGIDFKVIVPISQ